MRGHVLALLLVVLLLAGCARSTPRTSPQAAAPDEPVELDPTCLDGIVVDDELVPIATATATLLPGDRRAATRTDGSFGFCALNGGRYMLTVTAPGYFAYGDTIDFPQEDDLQVILKPQPVQEPRILVVPKVLHFTLGWTTLDSTLGRNGVDLTNCSPCSWSVSLDALPDHLVWESTWRRSPEPPPGITDSMFQILRAGAHFAQGEDIDVNEAVAPSSFAYTRAQLLEAESLRTAKPLALSGAMYCSGNPTWPCVDQRIQVYLSLFYDYADVPQGYTALPK